MEPQKEVENVEAGAYEMERRLLAVKNAYAENTAQKRDPEHAHVDDKATSPGQREKITISAEDRYHMVAIEAYRRAKQQNFDPQYTLRHWIEAQKEVDRRLGGNQPPPTEPHHDATLHGHEYGFVEKLLRLPPLTCH